MANPVPTPVVTDFGSLAGLRAQARAQDPSAMRKAAQQFEALFTQMLLKSARAANLSDDVLGGGQTAFYQDMFDQQMALHLSSGKGIGLADVLVRQMQGSGSAPLSAMPATPVGAREARVDVIPAKAGIPDALEALDARFRGHDGYRIDQSFPAAKPPADAKTFVDQLRPHAERAAKELGVPAHAILAQAAIETGWGRHVPARADGMPGHNYFGIKAGRAWSGESIEKTTNEFIGGRSQTVSAKFRAYGSVEEAFDDYVSFLKSNPRYAQALAGGDTKGFALGLQQAGYATDPAYSAKLLKVAHGPSLSAALSTPPAEPTHTPHRVRTWKV